jgi:hypothetical protein
MSLDPLELEPSATIVLEPESLDPDSEPVGVSVLDAVVLLVEADEPDIPVELVPVDVSVPSLLPSSGSEGHPVLTNSNNASLQRIWTSTRPARAIPTLTHNCVLTPPG